MIPISFQLLYYTSLFTRLEKLKRFTTVVFVDSIEDHSASFEKNDDSSLASYINDLNLSNIPTVNYNKNFSMSDLDDVFLSRNRETPTPMTRAKDSEYFKFNVKEFAVNKSPFISTNNGDYNQSDESSRSPSLKEFETIEKCEQNTLPRHKAPVITDDVFMYQNNYNLASTPNSLTLTGKPPLGPHVPSQR